MSKVQVIKRISEKSIILDGFDKIHYLDCYRIHMQSDFGIDKITTEIFRTPKWVNILMSLRNNIVGLFGLNTGSIEEKNIEPYYPVGSKAVYFQVLKRSENEIVMAENDKHLNFRTSVFVERAQTRTSIYLSTIVHYNNILGRLYFLPVRPFHKIIVKSLLRRYANEY
ncbi:MAG: DUF2867 domain-containing protein [Lentimicrobium sp.]